MDEIPNVMPIMVSFFTDGWTQQCIRCFQDWFPELKILVVDNNPTSINQIENWNFLANPNPKWRCLFKFCLAEREWLKEQSNVILLEPERKIANKQISHGQCVDIALNWCKENDIDIILCVEPDTAFFGVEWFYNQLEPILDDRWWMTATQLREKTLSHAVQPCPLMVKVNKIEWSFDQCVLGKQYYDFGQMLWHKFHERGRAKLVGRAKDFKHYWGGSYRDMTRKGRNCSLVTFL